MNADELRKHFPKGSGKVKRRFPAGALRESYSRLGSVHRVAEEFSTTGETVRQHLKTEGVTLNRSFWSDGEVEKLREAYSKPQSLDLTILAAQLGRPYAGIAGKALELGLTCRRGKQERTPDALERLSKAQQKLARDRPDLMKQRGNAVKAAHARNGHPRGMLGKTHSEAARNAISVGNSGRVRPIEETIKSMKTKLSRYGTMAANVRRGSWRAAWRTIGGVRKFYRSRWEANYAHYLEFQKINGLIADWKHECEVFWFSGVKRGCVSYLPDFKVTKNDGSVEFHEVKGWMDADSILKLERMSIHHPSVFVKVLDKTWFKENSRRLMKLIPDWER